MALTKGFHEVFDVLAEYAEETVEIQFYKLASKLKNDEASTETDVIKSLIESIPKVKVKPIFQKYLFLMLMLTMLLRRWPAQATASLTS